MYAYSIGKLYEIYSFINIIINVTLTQKYLDSLSYLACGRIALPMPAKAQGWSKEEAEID